MAPLHSGNRASLIVLILLACFACYQVGKPLLQRRWLTPADISNNEISRLDRAFQTIRPGLDNRETIGFLSNQGARERYLTQFCLAPRIVIADSIVNRTVALYKDIDSLALDSLTDMGFQRVDSVNAYLLLFRKAP